MKNTLAIMLVAVIMATSPLYAQEEQCPETVVSTEYIEFGFLEGEDSFSKCEIRKISTDCNNDDAEKIILVRTFTNKFGRTIRYFIKPKELKIYDHFVKSDDNNNPEYLYSEFFVKGPADLDDGNKINGFIFEISVELYEYITKFYNNSLPCEIKEKYHNLE